MVITTMPGLGQADIKIGIAQYYFLSFDDWCAIGHMVWNNISTGTIFMICGALVNIWYPWR